MTDAAALAPREWPRRLFHESGALPGPMLITLGGIHGNEPAGLAAIERVRADHALAAGDWIALAGNRTALARGVRFVHRDLNRGWSDDAMARLECSAPEARDLAVEDDEQRGLWQAIAEALRAARGAVYMLDLHTTSAGGFPFVVAGGDAASRAFASRFGPPVFLGLMDQLGSALIPWLAGRGVTGVAIEGGQNGAASSIERLAAAVVVALGELGILGAGAAAEDAHRLLEASRANLPRTIEIVARHAIAPGDDFRMEPGFANIQPIRAGTLLARDRSGEIRAREDGLVVMPLYQGQGDEGFFLGRAAAAS